MRNIQNIPPLIIIALFSLLLTQKILASFPYYGAKIGPLKQLHHGVSGDVYAVDSRTLFIKGFNYDGGAPAAYFYVGNTKKPSNEGANRLRDENGGITALSHRYRNKDITLSLPEGKTLRDIKWFSVWCDEFAVNFGDVSIPSNLDFPRPQKIAQLKGVHGVQSDDIVIVDAQTLLVPNFSYDGEAPDAKFWVGRGARPTAQGLRIPDENGKEKPLRRYERKTIVLTLPGDLTIFDIGHFGVWCEAFTVDFGHVQIPEGLNVPPSLKMLGISPQSKLNCEVLYDDLAFEVRWAVAGESIVFQLVAKLANNEYMSFGISPRKDRPEMIGSDVAVAWVDKETGKGFAQDYYIDDKSQCSGRRGTCPDVNFEDNTNSVRLLNAAMVNGYSIVTYQRSLRPTDKFDLLIPLNYSQAIVWAIGPLNERKECSFHSKFSERSHLIDFGRQPRWNCPMPEGIKTETTTGETIETDDNDDDGVLSSENKDLQVSNYQGGSSSASEAEYYENRPQALQRPGGRPQNQRPRPVPTPKPVKKNSAWEIPPIQCYEPEDGVFYAQMGPTGGTHGYPAITGHVGWGISWYINGLLIPEIHVVRGKTYTFVVEGGNNPDIPAKFHPFYITDDPIGGFEHKRDEEKSAVRIYAGVHRSRTGKVTPIGIGRLCNWTPDTDGPLADDFQSFGAYQRTLTLVCEEGEPGVITWTPDRNTPNTVYYQCFTHRYLGWKIHVHDTCEDSQGSASDLYEINADPATSSDDTRNAEDDEIAADASIRHETKVSPNENFLLKHQTDLIKNHNMNGSPPKLSFEITKSSEITKLISDGIRAAEALEETFLNDKGDVSYNSAAHTPSHISTQSQLRPLLLPTIPTPASPTSLAQPTVSTMVIPLLPKLYAEPIPATLRSGINPSLNITKSIPPLQRNNPNAHLIATLSQSQPIGLSEFLRPPQNSAHMRPVKLPGGRPFPVLTALSTMKKPPGILPQQMPLHRQTIAIPQPSVIVNHYRKPIPGILKPFVKEKPFPIQPLAASVLLLGQPTELRLPNESGLKSKSKPAIPVPYLDLAPQESVHSYASAYNGNFKKEKKPLYPSKNFHSIVKDKRVTAIVSSSTLPPPTFKKPFDIHEIKSDIVNITGLKPAINNGFKPDSVIVEGGFRPILRRQTDEANIDGKDQMARRREDPGSEIDEAMETDTLFLAQQQESGKPQNFEPIFIPSPLDSTNATLIPKLEPSKSIPVSIEENPSAAKLTRDSNQFNYNASVNIDDEHEKDNNDESFERSNEDDENDVLDINADSDENDAFDEIDGDKIALSAENIDAYYLPPENSDEASDIASKNIPVSYDGKAVFDKSLVKPPTLKEQQHSSALFKETRGLSKSESLVRNTPQFGPYNGEVPPSISDFFLENSGIKSVVNPITEYANPMSKVTSSTSKPISTKLQILKES